MDTDRRRDSTNNDTQCQVTDNAELRTSEARRPSKNRTICDTFWTAGKGLLPKGMEERITLVCIAVLYGICQISYTDILVAIMLYNIQSYSIALILLYRLQMNVRQSYDRYCNLRNIAAGLKAINVLSEDI